MPSANTLKRWVNEERLRPHSAGSTLPHLWPTCSSSRSPPLITARYFSSRAALAGRQAAPANIDASADADGLFADRISTGTMRANQLRLWFASIAHVLIEGLRRIALQTTDLADCQLRHHPPEAAQDRSPRHH